MNPVTPEQNKLAFVGISYMGSPIAESSFESGFELEVNIVRKVLTGVAAV